MRRKARGPKPKKQPKWMLPLGINLGVFAVCLLIAPPAWVIVNPLESLPLEEQAEDMRLAIYLQAQCLVGYELQNGELPLGLEDAGTAYPGIEHTVLGRGHFTLAATVGDEVITNDSAQPLNEWVGGGGTGKLLGGGDGAKARVTERW